MTSPDHRPDFPASDPWATRLGIVQTGEGDEIRLTMELTGDHLNFLDGAHGGALFSLAETALRAAAGANGKEPTLLDAHLALTAGGEEGDTFTATVDPVKLGRSLSVYRVSVTRGDGRLVGEFTGTVRF